MAQRERGLPWASQPSGTDPDPYWRNSPHPTNGTEPRRYDIQREPSRFTVSSCEKAATPVAGAGGLLSPGLLPAYRRG